MRHESIIQRQGLWTFTSTKLFHCLAANTTMVLYLYLCCWIKLNHAVAIVYLKFISENDMVMSWSTESWLKYNNKVSVYIYPSSNIIPIVRSCVNLFETSWRQTIKDECHKQETGTDRHNIWIFYVLLFSRWNKFTILHGENCVFAVFDNSNKPTVIVSSMVTLTKTESLMHPNHSLQLLRSLYFQSEITKVLWTTHPVNSDLPNWGLGWSLWTLNSQKGLTLYYHQE